MDTGKRVRLFLIVTALWSLAANFAHPVTPTLIKNQGFGDYMFGVALSCMMTANFLFSPFWGKMNSYISSRKSLLISNVGYGVGQVLMMLSTTEWQLAGARLVSGVFCGGVAVGMLTYIVNIAPEEDRGKILTIHATIQGVGSAFGFLIGGLMGEVSLPLTFWAQGISLSLCGVLFYVVGAPDATLQFRAMDRGRFLREINPFAAFAASRKFMSGVFLVLFGITTMQNLGFTAYEQSFNYYIKDQFGFSPAYNGLLKGAIGIITLVANFTICMWILRRTNVKRSLGFVFLTCTLSLTAALFVDHMPLFIVINILFFAFNGITLPLIQNLLAERARGEDSNLIMGFYNAMKSLGGIIGPFTAGMLYTAWPKNIFIFAGAAYLGGMLLAFLYNAIAKKHVEAEPVW